MCFRKIQSRNRPGEESITLEYLEAVASKYEEYLNSMPLTTEIIRISNFLEAEEAINHYLQARGLCDKKKKRKRFLLF